MTDGARKPPIFASVFKFDIVFGACPEVSTVGFVRVGSRASRRPFVVAVMWPAKTARKDAHSADFPPCAEMSGAVEYFDEPSHHIPPPEGQ